MKTNLLLAALLCGAISLAQSPYKKASFLKRNGRYYMLSTGAKIFSENAGTAPVLSFSWGKDKGKNRIFHWWDLEYTFGSKFKYQTTTNSNTPIPVTVSGKTSQSIDWRYNWAYYLGNNTNEETKFLPFLKLALSLELGQRRYGDLVYDIPSVSSSYYIVRRPTLNLGAAADFGIGGLYKINNTKAIKASAGYRYLGSSGTNNEYFINTSHPYINVGIRFLMNGNE
jgi:hypothetical protein